MLRYIIAMSLIALVTAYAVRQGGKPERTAALILVGIPLTDLVYHSLSGEQGIYHTVDLVHAAIDLVALVAIVWLALRADRFWTLWLGALQLIATLSHVIRALEVEMYPVVYAIIIRGPFWAQIFLVALGTWLHARRQRQVVVPNISRQS
ncbi:MAG: hypothetical protein A3J40_12625 [Erythrobacter sp. RIFCSPHIGHO2_12_FULL_63_10]|nr:MAG: hypothetical protein A3J40_12625 [Erythrobacter sp. RIFCSPHIGHO2_12_FULL_63_10]